MPGLKKTDDATRASVKIPRTQGRRDATKPYANIRCGSEASENAVYGEYRRCTYDLIVVGSGPAGQRSAIQAAKNGKRVAVVELHSQPGGACLHWGTVPSKSFRESVYRYSLGSNARKSKSLPEMNRLLERKNRVVAQSSDIISDQLARNDVELIQGRARLRDRKTVEVLDRKGAVLRTLVTDYMILATGARPVPPPHLAVDGRHIHDSNTILGLKRVPERLVVLGAGIIGCEYASIFATAGSRVQLVDKRTQILPSVDGDIVRHLLERFDSLGLTMRLGTEAVRIERQKRGAKAPIQVVLSNGRSLPADAVLIAMGRTGNSDEMGLEELGIERDSRGLLKVDAHFRTTVPTIYAVGDLIGAPALASTAFEQGRIAASHAFGLGDPAEREMNPVFPYGIYTIPEISTIGKTEEELRTADADFVVGWSRYREMARGQIVGDRWGLLKLLVDRKSLRILGVHIIGDNAADLIHIGQAVMDLGGDVRWFIRTVFNFPTHAEAYKTAAFHVVNTIRGQKHRAGAP
jgi:NAD(P) transhydrogenase